MLIKREADLPVDTVAVRCHDVAGRRRKVQVRITETGHVAVIVPPGETAEFTVDEAHDLWLVLRLAVIKAAGVGCPDADARPEHSYREVAGQFVVPCLDAVGRADRSVIISPATRGRVLFRAPAGGTAVLAPLQVGALRGALHAAVSRGPYPAELPTARTDAPTVEAMTA